MDPFVAPVVEALAGLKPGPAQLPLVSTVSGRWTEPGDYDAAYWGRNMHAAVRFAPAISQLIKAGFQHFLEVGPHPAFGASVLACAGEQCRGHNCGVAAARPPARATLLWAGISRPAPRSTGARESTRDATSFACRPILGSDSAADWTARPRSAGVRPHRPRVSAGIRRPGRVYSRCSGPPHPWTAAGRRRSRSGSTRWPTLQALGADLPGTVEMRQDAAVLDSVEARAATSSSRDSSPSTWCSSPASSATAWSTSSPTATRRGGSTPPRPRSSR